MSSTVGERLRGERIRLGYSLRKFAEAAGVALSTQQRFEAGDNAPGSEYLNRAADLGAEIFWIMRGAAEDDAVRDKREALYPPEVREMIDDYELCPPAVQQAVRVMLKNAADEKRSQIKRSRGRKTAL